MGTSCTLGHIQAVHTAHWILSTHMLLMTLSSAAFAVAEMSRAESMSSIDTNPSTAFILSPNKYPRAKCLDGSPGRYYWRAAASNASSQKFLIFFEGGGFCTDIHDCLDRSQGYLGSTVNDTHHMPLHDPYFDLNATRNPLLSSFNHVYVRYCDGAYYSGDRQEPVVVGAAGHRIYFQGRAITEALIDDLSVHHGLSKASEVVIAGCSAGAIRIFAHIDALSKMVKEKNSNVRVTALADSGFYLDLPIFTPLKHYVVDPKGQNATALLSPECLETQPPSQLEKCLIASVVGKDIKTPIFAWQSEFDRDQRGCEMTKACAADPACINQYGRNLSGAVEQWVSATAPQNAAFIDSCNRHCWPFKMPLEISANDTSTNPLQAFAQWYRVDTSARRDLWMQNKVYPCDTCCQPSTTWV